MMLQSSNTLQHKHATHSRFKMVGKQKLPQIQSKKLLYYSNKGFLSAFSFLRISTGNYRQLAELTAEAFYTCKLKQTTYATLKFWSIMFRQQHPLGRRSVLWLVSTGCHSSQLLFICVFIHKPKSQRPCSPPSGVNKMMYKKPMTNGFHLSSLLQFNNQLSPCLKKKRPGIQPHLPSNTLWRTCTCR